VKKKVIKNKKKKIKTEYSPAYKIVRTICFMIFIMMVITAIMGCFSYNFQMLFWKYVLIPLNDAIFFVAQFVHIKFSSVNISLFVMLVIACIVLSILIDCFETSKKHNKKEKYIVINNLRILLSILFIITSFMFMNLLIFSNNNPKLDTIYFKDKANQNYTLDQMKDTFSFVEDKVIELAKIQKRDDAGHIIYSDVEAVAISDLKKASLNYDVLKGIYPTHYYKFDKAEFSTDPSTYGLTFLYNVGINYELEAPQLLNSITHELCHTKGVFKENEAVLCSVMTGIESTNSLSNYAAYLEVYSRFLDAFSQIDIDKAKDSENRVMSLCLDNNYQEICHFYRKDVNVYVKDSDSILIFTYTLDNYDQKFLKDLFNKLRKYDLEISINDKKIREDLVFDEKYKDQQLKITINNDEKIFSEISECLKANADKFRAINQIYPNMYAGVNFTESEAINYYTSPIPNSNFITALNIDKQLELFDYSRATRLIMEYFDAKNIGDI